MKKGIKSLFIKYFPFVFILFAILSVLLRNFLVRCLWLFKYLPPCVFNRATGLLCPGCGNTRSVIRLLSGDILGSLKANITPVFLISFALLYCVERLLNFIGLKVILLPRSKYTYIIPILLFCVYFIIRNIPLFSFLHI